MSAHKKAFGGQYASEVSRGRFGGESQDGKTPRIIQIRRCPAKFVYVYWFFSLPKICIPEQFRNCTTLSTAWTLALIGSAVY